MTAPLLPRTAPVVVTGCSSGIGRATVLALLRHGRPVWATARQVDSLADLVTAGARVLALDVTDEDSMVEAVHRVVAEHGSVGGLVNNAGYALYGPVEELSTEVCAGSSRPMSSGCSGSPSWCCPGCGPRAAAESSTSRRWAAG